MILLNINQFVAQNNLKEVKNPHLSISSNEENGLFSENIFGLKNSHKWRSTYAYINLNTIVFHPEIYRIIQRSASKLIRLIKGDIAIKDDEIVEKFPLHDDSYKWGLPFIIANILYVRDILIKYGLIKTDTAKSILTYVDKNRDTTLVDKFIVIPPVYRDYTIIKTIKFDEINELYVKLISLGTNAITAKTDYISYNTISFQIQETVFNIFNELLNRVKGKSGLLRNNVLGRTLDFSGRAVIVCNPYQKPDEIGLPYKIAVRLFRPFLVHELLYNKRHASKLKDFHVKLSRLSIENFLDNIEQGNIPEADNFIISVLNKVIKDKVVLAKRDPALHRASIQAFKPFITKDDAISIAPAITGGFNADFDGDQMAVYLPLTVDGQKEAREKLAVQKNKVTPRNITILDLTRDIVAGMYLLTKEVHNKKVNINFNKENILDIIINYDWYDKCVYKNKVTTVGRAIIQFILRDAIEINDVLTKKDTSRIINALYDKFNSDIIIDIIRDLTVYMTTVITIAGKPISATEFKLPEDLATKKEEAIKKFNKGEIDSTKLQQIIDEITTEFMERKAHENSLIYDLISSGARGSSTQIKQITVAKSTVRDVVGNIYGPITSSIGDGLDADEYLYAAAGGRAGIIDRAINTSKTGYLTRQLVQVCSSVYYNENATYGSHKYLKIQITENIYNALKGRQLANGSYISEDSIGKTVLVKSPIYNHNFFISPECLPDYYRKEINVKNIGIVAAQTIGERSSQLIMRTFHTGGAAGKQSVVSDESALKYIYIENDDILAKTDSVVIFKKSDITGDILDGFTTDKFEINNYEIVLDNAITVDVSQFNNYEVKGEHLIVNIPKDGLIGSIEKETSVTYVERAVKLFNSKLPPDILLVKIWDLFYLTTKLPLWPFEIVISQMARDPENPGIPYRLGKMNKPPLMISLKQVPIYSTGMDAVLFENIGYVIDNIVLNNAQQKFECQQKSIISKLLNV